VSRICHHIESLGAGYVMTCTPFVHTVIEGIATAQLALLLEESFALKGRSRNIVLALKAE